MALYHSSSHTLVPSLFLSYSYVIPLSHLFVPPHSLFTPSLLFIFVLTRCSSHSLVCGLCLSVSSLLVVSLLKLYIVSLTHSRPPPLTRWLPLSHFSLSHSLNLTLFLSYSLSLSLVASFSPPPPFYSLSPSLSLIHPPPHSLSVSVTHSLALSSLLVAPLTRSPCVSLTLSL